MYRRGNEIKIQRVTKKIPVTADTTFYLKNVYLKLA